MKSFDEEMKGIMNMEYIKNLTNEEKKEMGLKIKKKLYKDKLFEKGSLDPLIMYIDQSSNHSSIPEIAEFKSSSTSNDIFGDSQQSNDTYMEPKSSFNNRSSKTKWSSHDIDEESHNKNDDDKFNDDGVVDDILNKIMCFRGEQRFQFCKQLLENLCS